MILRPKLIQQTLPWDPIILKLENDRIIMICPVELWRQFQRFAEERNCEKTDQCVWEKPTPPEYIYDWAAEIGFDLIRQGCVIDVEDEKIIQKIQSEDFRREIIRYIDYLDDGRFKNWFHIRWKKEDLYKTLKKILPQSRAYNYFLAVPGYYYREVVSFAKDWHFEFTDKAQKFLKTAPDNILILFDNHLKIPKKIQIPDELKDKTV